MRRGLTALLALFSAIGLTWLSAPSSAEAPQHGTGAVGVGVVSPHP